ncbi:3-beta hydroxysteroid dehydrogenase/isomerase [Artemisia annua]|uniref:3-beta hydroxysteroid dehydrogenase/isomerase n=1 Tax=Artemisia annua TaxID=35608 RepID=A0A2U1M5C9_ARTAN|nr:3-beta hydroxysteroid dehydrogenase/isomerase [Artemisia annua]
MTLKTYEEKGSLGQALRIGRAQCVSIDLLDQSQVEKACEEAGVVFHIAKADSSINNYKLQMNG